jgi:hypothetical protein
MFTEGLDESAINWIKRVLHADLSFFSKIYYLMRMIVVIYVSAGIRCRRIST